MLLQELIVNKGIDMRRTKLVRHNISNEVVFENFTRGNIDFYQSIQTMNRFKDCDWILSFLGTEGTNGKYLGCYKVFGYTPFDYGLIPIDYFVGDEEEHIDDHVIWNMQKTDILADMIDRLVIDWGKGAINWCQNGTTEKEILYILPKISEIVFTSYDKVVLSYQSLNHIVTHAREHKEWQERLSAVAGVYLITDTKTGKHYVGSASGEQGGIWGRWNNYAQTKHGGNKRLIELITADADYCNYFQFSILEVFPIKRDKYEILEYEQLYK
ncbi:MAG TPA: GIY-YIG nuclease family protein, partial [Desulfosporosinus sp.]|nr:GIY-YIG nuclease family protein [Desulfosporosinus sp.]